MPLAGRRASSEPLNLEPVNDYKDRYHDPLESQSAHPVKGVVRFVCQVCPVFGNKRHMKGIDNMSIRQITKPGNR